MIGPDVRNAIYQLHQAGMSQREISRRLHVSRNAVRKIVKQQGKFARPERSDKKHIDAQLLERLYRECDGWMQRIHEKLLEEEGIQIGYSTLTRRLHERLYLNSLPKHLPAPYQTHQRVTDQYGYVAFQANHYWVPGTRRDDVKVLQYADHVKIFQSYECLAEYPLPPDEPTAIASSTWPRSGGSLGSA